MTKEKPFGPGSASAASTGSGKGLRERAEEIAREKAARMPENVEVLSPEETRQMLHEPRVHQIELEMQNEELRRAQAELETSRARYFDLYDLAPVGYCAVSEKGLILEANLTTAILLGAERGALIRQLLTRFILKEDHAIYYQHRKQLFETHSTSSGQAGEPQACELRMVKKDGPAFWAHLEATAARDAGGAPVCRVVMSDITERKQAEAALQQAHDELEQLVVARTEALRQANEELRADITERKRAEKEVVETLQQLQETRDMLIQFEKHAAVGRSATGVAHEILNPASIISSQLQFLEEENLSEPARENVRVSREQLQRIVKISHDLLQFFAKKPRVLVGGDLRRVIEVGLQMTERRKEDHVSSTVPCRRPSLSKWKWTGW
jgi:PAS domain S-box-containing protein